MHIHSHWSESHSFRGFSCKYQRHLVLSKISKGDVSMKIKSQFFFVSCFVFFDPKKSTCWVPKSQRIIIFLWSCEAPIFSCKIMFSRNYVTFVFCLKYNPVLEKIPCPSHIALLPMRYFVQIIPLSCAKYLVGSNVLWEGHRIFSDPVC